VLIKLIVFLTVSTMCLYLLRSVWRMLVEIPDAKQVWVPDVVEDSLTRWISASLILNSGLFLVLMVQAIG
jgi:hypothetical protein